MTSFKGKKLLLTWGRGTLARSWNSPQGSLLLASRFGMDITIARPSGYDMDSNCYSQIKKNCEKHGSKFEIIDDPIAGYENADVVYSRHWITANAYHNAHFNKEEEIKKAMTYNEWITTEEKMKKTRNAIFTHPMPVDRGNEVEDTVASGERSVIYNVAGNRLHVQKSVLTHIMGSY